MRTANVQLETMHCPERQSLLTVGPIQLSILTLLTILNDLQKNNRTQPEQQLLLTSAAELIFHNHPLHSTAELCAFIRNRATRFDQLRAHQLLASITHAVSLTASLDGLYRLLNRLHNLTSPTASEAELEIQPDSPIGLYVRRCRLCISKLEFDQLSELATQLKSFCTGPKTQDGSEFQARAGIQSLATPSPGHAFLLPHPAHPELVLPTPTPLHELDAQDVDPVLQAYLDFTDSYAPDFNKSCNGLRKFYDIRSSVSTTLSKETSGKMSHLSGSNHQQALLSLAKLYFSFEAYPTAMDALEEATRLARLAGDRTIIDQCTCLRRRIMYFSGLENEAGGMEKSQVPLTGPIQAQAGLQSLRNLGYSDDKTGSKGPPKTNTSNGLNTNEWLYWDANEEIFSVFKSLFKAEPMNHLHARLFRASRMRISDSGDAAEGSVPARSSFDRVSWFAIQARIWESQGQTGLCEIYEDLALEVDEQESDQCRFWIEDRIKLISKSDVRCHRALRLAKKGNFYQALLSLCDQIRDNGSDFQSFTFIHRTLFQIFRLKAQQEKYVNGYSGDEDTLTNVEMLSQLGRHPSVFFPPALGLDSSPSVHKLIDELFSQAERLMDSGNHHAALCPIVSAISHADKMNLKLEQAKGIIMWSDVILHLQQQPASTSQPPPKDEDQREPVTTRWIFDKINSHRLLDIPGLLANHVLAAQLLFVVARCKILDLFSRNVQLLNPDRVYEILDLFGWIDILYRKIESIEGRKKVIGYQLIVIEELQTRLGTSSSCAESEEKWDAQFRTTLARHSQDLKERWMLLCSDGQQRHHHHQQQQQQQQQQPGPDKMVSGERPPLDQDFGALGAWLARVNTLFARASARRFI